MIDWDFADTCWEKDPRKYQYVAANYLKAMQSYLKETDLPKLEQLVVTKSLWDTVDILDRVVGSLVYEHPELEEIILILSPCRIYVTDFVSPSKISSNHVSFLSTTSKQCFELTLQPQNSTLSNPQLVS
nr:DNA alkylation repair protein [Streptococcus pneumoniae]